MKSTSEWIRFVTPTLLIEFNLSSKTFWLPWHETNLRKFEKWCRRKQALPLNTFLVLKRFVLSKHLLFFRWIFEPVGQSMRSLNFEKLWSVFGKIRAWHWIQNEIANKNSIAGYYFDIFCGTNFYFHPSLSVAWQSDVIKGERYTIHSLAIKIRGHKSRDSFCDIW